MKASDLIRALEESIAQHGDLPVLANVSGFGGYSVHPITVDPKPEYRASTLSTSDFEDEIEPHTWKDLFSEHPYPADPLDPPFIEKDYIEISLGSSYFAT